MLDPLRADIDQEKQANRITRKKLIITDRCFHCNAAPITIRIGGEEKVSTSPLAILESQFHCFPYLRICIRTSREITIGVPLFFHNSDIYEAGFGQCPSEWDKAGTVERRINNGDIAVYGRDHQLRDSQPSLSLGFSSHVPRVRPQPHRQLQPPTLPPCSTQHPSGMWRKTWCCLVARHPSTFPQQTPRALKVGSSLGFQYRPSMPPPWSWSPENNMARWLPSCRSHFPYKS